LGAGVFSAALLPAGAATDESAPGAVDGDEHETIPKPMEVSRIPVNTCFIEILLIVKVKVAWTAAAMTSSLPTAILTADQNTMRA
jgi:hypothetical protein